jgi:hypothetical protein
VSTSTATVVWMSTLEAIALGMMISWTPSVVVMAYFLWKAPVQGPAEKSSDGLLGVEQCESVG